MTSAHDAYIRHDPIGTRVPLVLDSPHSGNHYPDDFGSQATLEQLRQAEDAFVDELYGAAPRLGATLVAARFPRVYIDPNRSVLDIDASLLASAWPGPAVASRKTELGIGLIWRLLDTGEPIYNRKLSVEEVARRITRYHQPYQKAVKDALDETYAHFGAVWHINCHSMPAVSTAVAAEGPGIPRPDFVLGDRDGTTCDADFTHFVRDALVDMGFGVKINDPYKGVELVRAFSEPGSGRHSLQIEVNRRLYMDERSREKSANFEALAQSISSLLEQVAGYTAERGSHRCSGSHDHAHGDHDHAHCDHGHHHSHAHEHHTHSHAPAAGKRS